MVRRSGLPLVLFFLVNIEVFSGPVKGQDSTDEDETYRGKLIGTLNSYHHQVSGEVYAVNPYTIRITDFTYDGNGLDTFFWAGGGHRPGPQGFIVPNEYGRTNVLDKYLNVDISLTLPDRRKITDIRWLSVYDLTAQETFGDVFISEGFDPPMPQELQPLSRKSNGVESGPVIVLDAKTLKLANFSYDGKAKEGFFWVGIGPRPSSKGIKVPDQNGYVAPLRRYRDETVVLEMPGKLTVFDIDWFSIYDTEKTDLSGDMGSVVIPDELNVPPSLVEVATLSSSLPNCEQLHRDLQVHWEVFGPIITIQLIGQVEEDEYMAFGLSGSPNVSQMEGGDAVVAYMEGVQAVVQDYNLTAKHACVEFLGFPRGVCPDSSVGGYSDFQIHAAERKNGLNSITFRRPLISADPGDKPFPTTEDGVVIWAIGKLDPKKRPSFHFLYPQQTIRINFARDPVKNCQDFTRTRTRKIIPWDMTLLGGPQEETFNVTLGPPGLQRGYQSWTGRSPAPSVFYVNGFLAPQLYLQRGRVYTFKIETGLHRFRTAEYNPFIITDEPVGGYGELTDRERDRVKVFAGVFFTSSGAPRPTKAGRLCLWQHTTGDRRQDDDFKDFKVFRNSLRLRCDPEGEAGFLQVAPNSSWPDVVYYNSFTHRNTGNKIFIVDAFPETAFFANTAWSSKGMTPMLLLLLTFALFNAAQLH